jgi:uncharacterized protein YjbI with pentapeptide repeats
MRRLIEALKMSSALFLLAAPSLAVSTLPCPYVGAQSPSTPILAMGQDNACENWVTTVNLNQPGADISNSNLSYAYIAGILDGANLSHANMAFLETPICPGLSARNANLSFANLRNSRLVCSNFSGADFTHADLTGARSDYTLGSSFAGADFTDADLTNFNSLGASFNDAIFTRAILSGVTFAESSFARANFAGQNLSRARFLGGNLSDGNFSFANLTDVQVNNYNFNRRTILSRANFSHAVMTNFYVLWAANAVGTDFSAADLSNAYLFTSFSESDFSGAILYNAELIGEYRNSDFTNAVLIDTNVSQTQLYGSDLTGAYLSFGTVLAGATYDAFTVFPSGLTFVGPSWGLPGGASPLAAGMIANFGGNDLSGGDYSSANFMSANMGGTINVGTNFTNANLSSCNLQSSRLDAAILAGANLTSATLTNATYDEATVFPSGNTVGTPPWGLPGGASPWALRMRPVPEPSGLLSLVVGAAWLAGISMLKGGA